MPSFREDPEGMPRLVSPFQPANSTARRTERGMAGTAEIRRKAAEKAAKEAVKKARPDK
jgi:hypothetical protein